MQKKTEEEKVLELIEERGILKASELHAQGIHDITLTRLVERGHIQRIGHGIYLALGFEPSLRLELAVAAQRVSQGVVCLLSALSFHELTTQIPREVWMAVKWTPTIGEDEWPPLRFFRYSGAAYEEGIETHDISPAEEWIAKEIGEPLGDKVSGTKVQIYNPAKTVADCFKYRGKIGLDVSIEALRDTLRAQKATRDELWYYAKICRVQKIIRPYLEATA